LLAGKMASALDAPSSLLARDLVAYSDAQLDQYLAEHTQEGGAVLIKVADPENLPESFIQRLR
jgi:hypothetical protein